MPQAVTSPIGKFSSALLKFHLSSRSPDPSHELAVSHLEAWSVVSTAEMRRKAPQGLPFLGCLSLTRTGDLGGPAQEAAAHNAEGNPGFLCRQICG